MAYPSHLDGAGLQSWAQRVVTLLSARRDEINALNVFPVPDADTGSNMAHTMEQALAEANKVAEESPEKAADAQAVAAALASGSVKGARGNSGVVLSQVLRGVAQAATGGKVDGETFRNSLGIALKLVNAAITDPVDGTVITVLRATTVAVQETNSDELHDLVRIAVDAARVALAKTPSQLDVLREAGVVDAGGQGFVLLLEALLAEVEGEEITECASMEDWTGHGKPAFLEVMYYIEGADLDALHEALSELGDSLLIARDTDQSGTVHVHSMQAGLVIETSYAHGHVSDLRLELLPDAPQVDSPSRIVIAVAPSGPLTQLYKEAGAIVVQAGDTDTDFAARIIAEIRRAGVDEAILLPNGLLSHRELVDAELASHAVDATMTILPTARLVSGIAALAVHDAAQPMAVDTYAMAEAAGSMRTVELLHSDKAMLTQAGPCARGDVLAMQGSEVVLVADTLQDGLEKAVVKLLQGGGELVTLLVTAEAQSQISEEKLQESLRSYLRTHEDVAITVYPADGMGHDIEIGVE